MLLVTEKSRFSETLELIVYCYLINLKSKISRRSIAESPEQRCLSLSTRETGIQSP